MSANVCRALESGVKGYNRALGCNDTVGAISGFREGELNNKW